jgi:hypothetical protein
MNTIEEGKLSFLATVVAREESYGYEEHLLWIKFRAGGQLRGKYPSHQTEV